MPESEAARLREILLGRGEVSPLLNFGSDGHFRRTAAIAAACEEVGEAG